MGPAERMSRGPGSLLTSKDQGQQTRSATSRQCRHPKLRLFPLLEYFPALVVLTAWNDILESCWGFPLSSPGLLPLISVHKPPQ